MDRNQFKGLATELAKRDRDSSRSKGGFAIV